MSVPTHGNSGYIAGCRCDECRRGAAEYKRALRERQRDAAREQERSRRAAQGLPVRDLLGVESPDWYELAECRGAPQEIFYPHSGESSAPAKEMCPRCPVSVECLAWALDHREQHGVWGGATAVRVNTPVLPASLISNLCLVLDTISFGIGGHRRDEEPTQDAYERPNEGEDAAQPQIAPARRPISRFLRHGCRGYR